MQEYLDRRYAQAIFEVALDNNKVEQYIDELKEIQQLIVTNKEVNQIINHPQISTSRKEEIFKSIFQGKVDKEILSFLLVLLEKKRITELNAIIIQIDKIRLENDNKIIAIVKTVVPLKDNEKTALIGKLNAKYKKSIILQEHIDESILGGVYVRIGDDVIDGTIKNKIQEIKKLMLIRA